MAFPTLTISECITLHFLVTYDFCDPTVKHRDIDIQDYFMFRPGDEEFDTPEDCRIHLENCKALEEVGLLVLDEEGNFYRLTDDAEKMDYGFYSTPMSRYLGVPVSDLQELP